MLKEEVAIDVLGDDWKEQVPEGAEPIGALHIVYYADETGSGRYLLNWRGVDPLLWLGLLRLVEGDFVKTMASLPTPKMPNNAKDQAPVD